MASKNRVKLGIDTQDLSRQLIQLNRLIEENYQKSFQGQSNYNKLLTESLNLLTQQAQLVNQISNTNSQNIIIGGGITPNINSINGGENNKEVGLLTKIQESLEQIWEKLSEGITVPIPVYLADENASTSILTSGQQVGQGQEIQEGQVGTQGGQSQKSGGGGSLKGGITNASNTTASLITQTDPNYILASVAGMIPMIGFGASKIISKLISEAEEYERGRLSIRATAGQNVNLGSFVNIGLKDADAFKKIAAYYPSNINLKREDLEFEKGYGISGGTMDALLRAFREDVAGNIGASVIGVDYLQGLVKRGGISSKEVRGYSEEYLKLLVELNQRQLETTGRTYSIINGEIIQQIAQLDDAFENPVILEKIVSSLEGGLKQAKNPQSEAIQLYALSQIKPGASLWDLEKMREDPFGKESVGYLENVMDILLSMGGNREGGYRYVKGFFGDNLSNTQVEQLVEGYKTKKAEGKAFTSEDAQSIINQDTKLFGRLEGAKEKIKNEASVATSDTQRAMAKIENTMAKYGMPLIEFSAKIFEKVDWLISKLEGYLGDETLENDILDALGASNGSLVRTNQNNPNPSNLSNAGVSQNTGWGYGSGSLSWPK